MYPHVFIPEADTSEYELLWAEWLNGVDVTWASTGTRGSSWPVADLKVFSACR